MARPIQSPPAPLLLCNHHNIQHSFSPWSTRGHLPTFHDLPQPSARQPSKRSHGCDVHIPSIFHKAQGMRAKDVVEIFPISNVLGQVKKREGIPDSKNEKTKRKKEK